MQSQEKPESRALRIAPVDVHKLSSDQTRLLANMGGNDADPSRLILTLAHSPLLLKQVSRLAGVFQGCSIPPADRELVVLNAAAFCRSNYLFAEHAPIATQAGLTDIDLQHLWNRMISPSWSTHQTDLIAFSNNLLSNDSFSSKPRKDIPYSDEPATLIELIMLIGFYRMIGVVANAIGLDVNDFGHDANVPHEKKATDE